MQDGFQRGAFKAFGDAFGVAGKAGVLGADLQDVVAKAVPRAEQEHGFFLDLAGADFALRGQRVRHGHGGEEGLVIQGGDGEVGFGEGLGQDGAVDVAAAQHFQQAHGVGFLQEQGHLRREADVVAHQIGQQVGADGGDDAQFERAGQGVFAALGDLADFGGLLKHALGLAHDFCAQRGDGDFAGVALEEFDLQLFFQFFDGDGQGGLRDEAGFGGFAKVFVAGHGNDVFELGQRHGAVFSKWGGCLNCGDACSVKTGRRSRPAAAGGRAAWPRPGRSRRVIGMGRRLRLPHRPHLPDAAPPVGQARACSRCARLPALASWPGSRA